LWKKGKMFSKTIMCEDYSSQHFSNTKDLWADTVTGKINSKKCKKKA